MATIQYNSCECVEMANPALELLVTQSVGPRILSLRLPGGENLFAELPDFAIETPTGPYRFWGGHRLWRAPETFANSYYRDESPVDIRMTGNTLTAVQPVEPDTGIQKTLRIELDEIRPAAIVHHSLANRSSRTVEMAAWAITQFRTGGIAVIPHPEAEAGMLPTRKIALWGYTDINNPSIRWGNRYTRVHAETGDGKLKIGLPNPRGWMAYWHSGILFVKKAAYDPGAIYCDFGSSSEVFCNDQFLELETLSGLARLAPGEEVTHTERWELYNGVEAPLNEDAVARLATEYDLG